MKIKKCTKNAFVVIGKEGSTLDGQGFIQKLWSDANSHFSEVQPLAKKDDNGNLVGIWGAMSDYSHLYKPWEDNFSRVNLVNEKTAESLIFNAEGSCFPILHLKITRGII